MDSEKQYWSQLLSGVREGAGLNQSELAQRLAMNRSSVSLVETGARLPSVSTLEAWIAECGYAMRIVPQEENDALEGLDDETYELVLRLARQLHRTGRAVDAIERTTDLLDTLERRGESKRPRVMGLRRAT